MCSDDDGFEPILLNLASSEDYYVITQALDDFAGEHEHRADGSSGLDVEEDRALAARARRLVADIERQLDANSAARRASGA